MKILLSAYSCFPCQTSEPGNAWRIIREALKEHEVWAVIADAHQYRELTEPWLAQNPLPDFHPVFLRLPPALQWLSRRPATSAIYYHLWQERLRGLVRDLHAQVRFDLVHHVTYGRYWSPSGLRELNLPFIWGPVGAAETPPGSFVRELPLKCRLTEAVRDGARIFCERTAALRATARAATIAIGVTRESCDALARLGAARVEPLPQIALPDTDLAQFAALPPPPGPLRALCIGRHVYWKGFQLAIRAFAQFARKSPDAELWIVNQGPFRAELERTAAASGAGDRVKFLGTLPQYADVLERLGRAHVLLHPALHEAFGNVCAEALAAGRPVGCLDIGGPASQITPATGFAAPVASPAGAVAALAGFLETLDRDRPRLAAMSAAARAHARETFSMQAVSARLRRFYAEAIEQHQPKRT